MWNHSFVQQPLFFLNFCSPSTFTGYTRGWASVKAPSAFLLHGSLDAIDGMYEKTALILAFVNLGIPIVTCGGAAGRMDPTQIVIDDITKIIIQMPKVVKTEVWFSKGSHSSEEKEE